MAAEKYRIEIPDQSGRVAVVTGANSGIGFHSARRLAEAGAVVVLACRNAEKGAWAVSEIESGCPDPRVRLVQLDLADLASVRSVAAELRESFETIDLLINNAGVMGIERRETAEGFEMQIGTNHFGHFALTGLLFDRLGGPDPRVVTVSSMAHRYGRIDLGDLHGERRYSKWGAYGQSKLANLLFTQELARRARAAGSSVIAAGSHPGWASTNLQAEGRGIADESFVGRAIGLVNRIFGQSAADGALPTLYAATAADVVAGGYYGPSGFMEQHGVPAPAKISARALDSESAAKLWHLSEDVTGVSFGLPEPVA